VAALIAVSIWRPANRVPQVLLGAWLCASAAFLAWSPRARRGTLRWRILLAPAGPLFLGGLWVWTRLRRDPSAGSPATGTGPSPDGSGQARPG